MCVYVCMGVYMLYNYVCTHMRVFLHVHSDVCVCVYACVYACVYVCVWLVHVPVQSMQPVSHNVNGRLIKSLT